MILPKWIFNEMLERKFNDGCLKGRTDLVREIDLSLSRASDDLKDSKIFSVNDVREWLRNFLK